MPNKKTNAVVIKRPIQAFFVEVILVGGGGIFIPMTFKVFNSKLIHNIVWNIVIFIYIYMWLSKLDTHHKLRYPSDISRHFLFHFDGEKVHFVFMYYKTPMKPTLTWVVEI